LTWAYPPHPVHSCIELSHVLSEELKTRRDLREKHGVRQAGKQVDRAGLHVTTVPDRRGSPGPSVTGWHPADPSRGLSRDASEPRCGQRAARPKTQSSGREHPVMPACSPCSLAPFEVRRGAGCSLDCSLARPPPTKQPALCLPVGAPVLVERATGGRPRRVCERPNGRRGVLCSIEVVHGAHHAGQPVSLRRAPPRRRRQGTRCGWRLGRTCPPGTHPAKRRGVS